MNTPLTAPEDFPSTDAIPNTGTVFPILPLKLPLAPWGGRPSKDGITVPRDQTLRQKTFGRQPAASTHTSSRIRPRRKIIWLGLRSGNQLGLRPSGLVVENFNGRLPKKEPQGRQIKANALYTSEELAILLKGYVKIEELRKAGLVSVGNGYFGGNVLSALHELCKYRRERGASVGSNEGGNNAFFDNRTESKSEEGQTLRHKIGRIHAPPAVAQDEREVDDIRQGLLRAATSQTARCS